MDSKQAIRVDNLGYKHYKIDECECGANDWFENELGEYVCHYCDAKNELGVK